MNQLSYTHKKECIAQSKGLILPNGSTELSDFTGHAIFRDNPFEGVAGNYAVLEFQEGATVTSIVNLACIDNSWLKNYIVVKICDTEIPRNKWDLVKLKKTAPIQILVVPQGGGAGNIIKQVAMVAVAVVAAVYLAPAVAAYAGFAAGSVAYAATVAVAVIATTMVASLALNAIFPPPSIAQPSLGIGGVAPTLSMGSYSYAGMRGMSESASEASTFQFSTSQNSSTQYAPVPKIYGQVKVAPNYAAIPFIESIGTQQYMYLLFDFGYAPLAITDLKIGENPIDTYTGVTYKIHESFVAGDTLTIYNKDIFQEDYSLQLLHGSYRTVTTAVDSTQAILDFQFGQGLSGVDLYSGDLQAKTVDISVEFRKVGDTAWSNFTTIVNAVTGVGSVSGSNIRVTNTTARPFFTTLTLTFPTADEYEIRTSRVTENSDSRYVSDDVFLSTLKSVKPNSPILSDIPHTIVEMKILANDQLSGMVDNFTAVATSILPTWNGSAWVNAATRNPAWHYLDVLRGNGTVKPAEDSRIDLEAFKDWAAWCDEPASNEPLKPKAQCDLVISGGNTAWQALKMISSTGDATPSLRAGKYSISIDRLKDYPVQLFTPRNSNNFSSNIGYHQQPHALRVQYVEPEQEWQSREIIVYDDGYDVNNATEFEVMEIIGVTNFHHAYRLGRRALAQGRLRNETFSIDVGVENILATRGDLVRLAYDIPKIGRGWARISEINGQEITIDENFTAIEIGNYIRIRVSNDTQLDLLVTDVIDVTTVEVSGSLSQVKVGQLIVYGVTETMTLDCLVKSISPTDDLSASLELVAYAPEIYNAETDPIPDYDPLITTIDDIRPGAVINLQASEIDTVVNRYHYLSIALSWNQPSGIYPQGYAIYELQNNVWVRIGNSISTQNSFYAYKDVRIVNENGEIIDIIGRELRFAVVALGAGASQIQPAEAPQITITPQGDIVKPIAPASFDIDIRSSQTISIEWQHANNDDISHYYIKYSPDTANASIESATVIVERVSFPTTNITIPSRLGTYFIKTVDTTGNVSDEYGYAITPTSVLTNDKEITTVEDVTWDGTYYQSELVGSEKVQLGKSGGTSDFFPIGYYYFNETLDFGQIYPAHFSSKIKAHGFKTISIMSNWGTLNTVGLLSGDVLDDDWDAYLEIRSGNRTSAIADWGTLDTVVPSIGYATNDFGAWRKFYAGEYTGRVFQFRLVLVSSRVDVGVKVSRAYIDVTSPIRIDGDYDIIAPSDGIRIEFDPAFQQIPAIGITQDDITAGDRYTITNKSRTGFDISFYNASSSVSRQFDWIARGYGKEVSVIPPSA